MAHQSGVADEPQTDEQRFVGQPVRRREDPRLITGQGRYVADVRVPGCLDVAFHRSPYAHARIVHSDAQAARSVPGVVAAFTGTDLASLAPTVMRPAMPALASGEVRFVGEPVAAVVAGDRYAAEDGADAVAVAYEELPVVVDLGSALDEGAPRATPAETNLAVRFAQRVGDTDAALRAADVVVHRDLILHRNSAFPLEGRGMVAQPDPTTGGLLIWAAHQSVHQLRDRLGGVLGLADRQIRIISPDVGGGFGVKNGLYPEDVVTAWLALHLGRPVRWIEDRREHFQACQHERETVMSLDLAARADGTVTGVRARLVIDTGPYARAPFVGSRALQTLPGPYRVPNYDAMCDVVYTNKMATGPYRGAGRPQGNFAMERLMDALADATGLDRAEVRRRNLIRPEEMPYDTGMQAERGRGSVVYDSGDYPAALQRLLAVVDPPAFRRRQAAARAERRYVGLGIACNNEDSGGGGFEGARLRIDGRGHVAVYTGSTSQGQGHETAYAQIVADRLGLRPEDVSVVGTDTATIPLGVGTFGSRSAAVAGGAIAQASSRLHDKVLRVAGRLMEAAPADLELLHGRVQVRGAPAKTLSLAEVAAAANTGAVPRGDELGLEETVYFRPDRSAYAYGAHAAEVEIDPATGRIEISRYVVVHDCGRLINPLIVEGQVHGGVLHGLADAMYSEIVHDDNGQLLTSTFMDYLLPTTAEMPRLDLHHTETPSPLNPLGTKGAGEGGTIPALAALAAAVEDALAPFGARISELPMTPQRIRHLVEAAAGERAV